MMSEPVPQLPHAMRMMLREEERYYSDSGVCSSSGGTSAIHIHPPRHICLPSGSLDTMDEDRGDTRICAMLVCRVALGVPAVFLCAMVAVHVVVVMYHHRRVP